MLEAERKHYESSADSGESASLAAEAIKKALHDNNMEIRLQAAKVL